MSNKYNNIRQSLRDTRGIIKQTAQPDATFVAAKHTPLPRVASISIPVKRTLGKRLTGHSLASSPAYYLARDVIGKVIGLNGTTYTEQDFTNEQLRVIDEQVRYRIKQNNLILNDYFQSHPTDTIVMGLGANTLYPKLYGRPYGLPKMKEKFTTPLGQVETILGDYGIRVFANGYEVFDTYDFNTGQGVYNGSMNPYAIVRRWAGKYGHKDTDDNGGKLKFKINRTVTMW